MWPTASMKVSAPAERFERARERGNGENIFTGPERGRMWKEGGVNKIKDK